MFRIFAISLLLLSAACARLTGDIQSFSTLTEAETSETLIVKPFPEDLENSLEYQSYKRKLETHLVQQGFQIVQSEDQAKLIAFFHYSIDDGVEVKESTYNYPRITYGGSVGSGGSSNLGVRYTMPIYMPGSTATTSYTTYNRNIAVDIVIANSLEDEGGPTVLYEGRLRSKGRCGVLSEVMDEMLTLLFEKFPDQSGKASIEQEADC